MKLRGFVVGLLLVPTAGCVEGRIQSTVAVEPSPRVEQSQPQTPVAVATEPSRSAASFVSAKVTSMTIDYTSPIFDFHGHKLTSKPYHRVVTGPLVQQLGQAFNALTLVDPGSGACPRDDQERFIVDMDNGGHELTFSLLACGRVQVEALGGFAPELSTSGDVNDLVVAAVGAPKVR